MCMNYMHRLDARSRLWQGQHGRAHEWNVTVSLKVYLTFTFRVRNLCRCNWVYRLGTVGEEPSQRWYSLFGGTPGNQPYLPPADPRQTGPLIMRTLKRTLECAPGPGCSPVFIRASSKETCPNSTVLSRVAFPWILGLTLVY
jgi:hypothetical protein